MVSTEVAPGEVTEGSAQGEEELERAEIALDTECDVVLELECNELLALEAVMEVGTGGGCSASRLEVSCAHVGEPPSTNVEQWKENAIQLEKCMIVYQRPTMALSACNDFLYSSKPRNRITIKATIQLEPESGVPWTQIHQLF